MKKNKKAFYPWLFALVGGCVLIVLIGMWLPWLGKSLPTSQGMMSSAPTMGLMLGKQLLSMNLSDLFAPMEKMCEHMGMIADKMFAHPWVDLLNLIATGLLILFTAGLISASIALAVLWIPTKRTG